MLLLANFYPLLFSASREMALMHDPENFTLSMKEKEELSSLNSSQAFLQSSTVPFLRPMIFMQEFHLNF